MSKNQVLGTGDNITFTAPAGGVVSGVARLIGGLFGIPLQTAAATEPFVLQTKGVFVVNKLGTDVVTEGQLLYWDNGNSRLTTTASTHKLVGCAAAAAGSGVSTVQIRLNGTAS
jgi:predicted RecA/RadA family phage recombinase